MLRTVFGQFCNLPGQLCPAQHRAGHGAAELQVLADGARCAADDPANVRFAQQLAGDAQRIAPGVDLSKLCAVVVHGQSSTYNWMLYLDTSYMRPENYG